MSGCARAVGCESGCRGRGGLGGGQGEQLGGEGLDLSLDGGGIQVGQHVRQDRLVFSGHGFVPVGSPVRGGRPVVLLGDLGAVADLGDQLLLRQEVVRDLGLQQPDLVQQRQFAGVS